MAGRTQAEIDVLPYQKVTKAMLHGDPDEGNDVSEVNLTEYVLEAEVLLSHSWVEDMEECQKGAKAPARTPVTANDFTQVAFCYSLAS